MKKTKRITLAAMLLSVMMILGYIESLFPVIVGVPGIKIGLSNSVLMLSLYWLGIPFSFMLMLGKVVLTAFTFGSLQSMQYALAGGLLSMLVMIAAMKLLPSATTIGVGVLGACFIIGQMTVAILQLQTGVLVYYLAILMVVGI